MWWSTILPITDYVHFNFLSFLFYWKRVACIILLTEFKYSCFEICNLCSVGGPTIPKKQKEIQNGRENISNFPLERKPGWGAMTEISFLSWLKDKAILTTDICSNSFPFWFVMQSGDPGASDSVWMRRCLRKKPQCCHRAGDYPR